MACRECEIGEKLHRAGAGATIHKPGKTKEAKMEDKKVCPECGEKQPLSAFTKNKKRPDGLSRLCRGCKATKDREYRKQRKQKKEAAKKPAASPGPKVMDPGNGITPGKSDDRKRPVFYLDLTGREELADQLEQAAIREFRTPEQQAMYILNTVLGGSQ